MFGTKKLDHWMKKRQGYKWFQPRDIGCNRIPVYDDNGVYLRGDVREGFWFLGTLDIPWYQPKNMAIVVVDNNVFTKIKKYKNNTAHTGILIGWVKDQPPIR